MAEYIEREAVLCKMQKIATEAWKMRIKANVETVWNEAQDVLRFFPAADVRPVKPGKWLDDWETGCSECSVCHDSFLWEDFKGVADWNYCPNCGADTREES